MSMENCDIVISGGGVAGLTAACLFGSAGYHVICVDPAPPVTERNSDGADLRSTAFLQPSVGILERAGVWRDLSPHATALQVMRIVDAGGVDGMPRATRDFDASDVSELPFGWNLPNWLIRRELLGRLSSLPSVDFRPGVATTRMLARTKHAKVWLSDDSHITCDLVIAADGRGSRLRSDAGIEVATTRYGQKALAFAVTHEFPHDNISTEIHRSGGPFTLVPLPDHGGHPSSAIVWMERSARAIELSQMDQPAFEAELATRSCGLYGKLSLASNRTIWPIIAQIADRFAARRLALIAEAAHVVPPIGAQGLNMSLADMGSLLDLARVHPLGSDEMLTAYDKARRLEVRARVQGIDMLNRVSMSDAQWLKDLRSRGIGMIHDARPVRKALMQLGLGSR